MNRMGKPDAGNLPVRFEEGGGDGVGRAIPTLLTVARLGGLGHAARELCVTKSAISNHMRDLERRVGHSLFMRTATGATLTAAGSRLLPVAQQALESLATCERAMEDLGRQLSGTVHIGMVGDAIWLRAPQVMAYLHRHHPGLRVHLHQAVHEAVPNAVLEGRLTAGWVLGAVHEAGLATRVLGQVRLRVAGPPAWAQQLAQASLGELADYPWVDAPHHSPFTLHRQALFASSGLLPTGCFQADSERAFYGIAAEGLALTLLREDLALEGQKTGELAVWPGAVPDLPLRFVLPTIRQDEPLGQALFAAVLRVWGNGRGW